MEEIHPIFKFLIVHDSNNNVKYYKENAGKFGFMCETRLGWIWGALISNKDFSSRTFTCWNIS